MPQLTYTGILPGDMGVEKVDFVLRPCEEFHDSFS